VTAPDRSEEDFEDELRPKKPQVIASIFGVADDRMHPAGWRDFGPARMSATLVASAA
jgi:hypothetical protein